VTQRRWFSVLGPVRAWRGRVEIGLGSPQQKAVLAALLLRAGNQVPLHQLIDALWSDEPPASAAQVIRTYVYRLRRVLTAEGEPALIDSAGTGYVLHLPDGELDLAEFRQRMAAADAARGRGDLPAAADELRHALALWKGEALAGLPGQYAEQQRTALAKQQLDAQASLLAIDVESGALGPAIAELTQVVAEHPLDERFRRLLMLALYKSGQQAAAIAVYQEAQTLLADELGIDPGPALQALYLRILRAEPDPPDDPGHATPGPAGPAAANATGPAGASGPPGGSGPAGPGRDAGAAGGGVDRPGAPDGDSPGGPAGAGDAAAAGPAPGVPVAPAQLPPDLPSFTGRPAELAWLDALLPDTAAVPARMVISTVHGMAGTGKTSLATHWAHRVAHRFPDGQVYLNLRGFDPGYPPLEPAEALRILFDAFGVDPQRIPVSLDAQTALYRSLLAGRRVLILLDNARDAEQVRPLLPGAPGCLVVVTSRSQLSSLVALDQAQPLPLDVLPDAEARAFLTDRIGPDRIAAEPGEVADIARLCGGLPLALTIVAARAVLSADTPLAAITAQLHADHGTLDAFSDADSTLDVRSIFSWSYRGLSEPAARLFRLLPLHPGVGATAAAVASLAGVPLRQARGLAGELIRTHLLRELSPGRYVLHDLLRAYAAELRAETDPAADPAGAVRRLLDHLLHTARAAAELMQPRWPLVRLPAPLPGTVVELLPDESAAAAWLTAERQTIAAALRLAADAGLDRVVWDLAATVADLFQRQGHWAEEIAMQRLALAAAERLGDLGAQAQTHRWLGGAYARSGRPEEGKAGLLAAVALFERLGDLSNQSRTYRGLAFLYVQVDDNEEALRLALRALELCRQAGDEIEIVSALNDSGWCYALLGDYDNALRNCQQALRLQQELVGPTGEASILDSLGYIQHAMGKDAEAIECYQRALAISESVGHTYNCALTRTHLGECYRALGDLEAAAAMWLRALAGLEQLRLPAAKQVRGLLEEIGAEVPDPLA
jgi:DNA-binding SARP family transcriptional activator/Tfp pilus assembly protein PilF